MTDLDSNKKGLEAKGPESGLRDDWPDSALDAEAAALDRVEAEAIDRVEAEAIDGVEAEVLGDVSALLDGELEPSRLLEVIDRLIDDPACRSFYRRARALDGLAEALEPLPRTEAPAAVWQRIAQACDQPAGPTARVVPLRQRSLASRVFGPLAAAAAVILAISLGVWMRADSRPTASLPTVARTAAGDEVITVGGDAGKMTDERFVALATELLEADRRYRREMAEIIRTVESSVPSETGSAEPARLNEGQETSLLGDGLDTLEDGRTNRNLNVRLW